MIPMTDFEAYGRHLAEAAEKVQAARQAAHEEYTRLSKMEKHIRNARYALDNLVECVKLIDEGAAEDDDADEAAEASFVDRLKATGAVIDAPLTVSHTARSVADATSKYLSS